jgi:uncharacterized protein (TIGR00299 family) protein
LKLLYFDLIGGAAGDMLMAALIDSGLALSIAQDAVSAVVPDLKISESKTQSAGLRARRIEVSGTLKIKRAQQRSLLSAESEHVAHRPYRVVKDLVERSGIEPAIKTRALAAFHLLAVAEGQVHGVPPEEVEFHEVGSDDAIADIVGVSALIHALAPEEIACSPIPMARGLTRGGHGPIPLPGPAAMEILRGVPLEGVDLQGETITPTGAALLRANVTRFGNVSKMIVDHIGIGAGTKSWPDRPNIVRVFVGRSQSVQMLEVDEDCIVEANLDDMSPEHVAVLTTQLFRAGAIDVWTAPIAMKKQRSGVLVSALVRRTMKEAIAAAYFQHSTTLGVRVTNAGRIRIERTIEEVETPYGRVRVKLSVRGAGPPQVAPEHEDCERLAEKNSVSVRAVFDAALYAVWSKGRGSAG